MPEGKVTGEIQISSKISSELKQGVRNIPDFKSGIEKFSEENITALSEVLFGGGIILEASDLHIEPASFYNTSLNLKATLWDIIYTQSRSRSIILAQSICQAANRNMGLRILGVKGAPFYVLKGTRIPAVLVEVGFVSHPSEERYLRSGFYRQQLAEAICEGILNYSRQYELAGLH